MHLHIVEHATLGCQATAARKGGWRVELDSIVKDIEIGSFVSRFVGATITQILLTTESQGEKIIKFSAYEGFFWALLYGLAM